MGKESWEEEAEEEDNGPGEGGGLAVWKLSGEVEFILEALEIESVSEVIIKRDWMGIRKEGIRDGSNLSDVLLSSLLAKQLNKLAIGPSIPLCSFLSSSPSEHVAFPPSLPPHPSPGILE